MITTWDVIGIRPDEAVANRLWFEPFGELDFLDLPAPFRALRRERAAVLIETLERKWYRLGNYSEPERPYVAPMTDWVMVRVEVPQTTP